MSANSSIESYSEETGRERVPADTIAEKSGRRGTSKNLISVENRPEIEGFENELPSAYTTAYTNDLENHFSVLIVDPDTSEVIDSIAGPYSFSEAIQIASLPTGRKCIAVVVPHCSRFGGSNREITPPSPALG